MPHDREDSDAGDDVDTTLVGILHFRYSLDSRLSIQRAPLQAGYEGGYDEESEGESDYTSDADDDDAPPPSKMAKTLTAQRQSADDSDSSIECID
mgnify:CR=1 FL=1